MMPRIGGALRALDERETGRGLCWMAVNAKRSYAGNGSPKNSRQRLNVSGVSCSRQRLRAD
jgi:hypothetical protein